MFLKSFHVKTNTAIKGSDRKKVRQQITSRYGDRISEDEVREMIPNKGEMSVMKIFTATHQTVLLYCADKTPLWFDLDGALYPTVYTLWKYPDLVQPVFITHPPVMEKLLGGADLMLPGIVLPPPTPPAESVGDSMQQMHPLGRFDKGTLCAVRLQGNMSPIGLGHTLLSSHDMFMSCMRGKGVNMLHLYRDQLWAAAENKTGPPLIAEPEHERSDDVEDVTGSDSDINEDEDGGDGEINEDRVSGDTINEDEDESKEEELQGADVAGCSSDRGVDVLSDRVGQVDVGSDSDTNNPTQASQTDVQDALLYRCLCQSIRYKVRQGKACDLPVLDSHFYRNYILTCCGPGELIDIKKSSYKKVSQFLSAMSDRGLITLTAMSKGVRQISAVNRQHPDVVSVCEVSEGGSISTASAHPASAAGGGEGEPAPPTVTPLYFITAHTLRFFTITASSSDTVSKGKHLTADKVRDCLAGYVRSKGLNSNTAKGHVELDDILGDLVLGKGERMSVERLPWGDVINRTLQRMSPGYQVQFPPSNNPPGTPAPPPLVKKGPLEPITLTVTQRAGNKKVTGVTNLEVYGICASKFAHRLQLLVQASTSVTPVGEHRPGMVQVGCQGNQVNHVVTMLTEEFGINKKHISGADKGIKEKKHKR